MSNKRFLAAPLFAALALSAVEGAATQMVAVSADIVEIGGSVNNEFGFKWNEILEFGESSIPGIIKTGEFQRRTQLAVTLRMLQSEGKAQLLANPKIIAKSGTQAQFNVGGKIPYPVVNAQQVSTEFKDYGVVLNVAPTVLEGDKKDVINVHVQIQVSNPDFSNAVTVGNTAVPSLISRSAETEVELKNGDTIVIGGLKQSKKNVAKSRIPFLGRIPLLGWFFTTSNTREEQSSLFLFLTIEIVK